jgi:hypothetical protein
MGIFFKTGTVTDISYVAPMGTFPGLHRRHQHQILIETILDNGENVWIK